MTTTVDDELSVGEPAAQKARRTAAMVHIASFEGTFASARRRGEKTCVGPRNQLLDPGIPRRDPVRTRRAVRWRLKRPAGVDVLRAISEGQIDAYVETVTTDPSDPACQPVASAVAEVDPEERDRRADEESGERRVFG